MIGWGAALLIASAPAPQVCAPFDQLALAGLPARLDPYASGPAVNIWRDWSLQAPPDRHAVHFRIQANRSVADPSYEVRGWMQGEVWRLQAREGRTDRRFKTEWAMWRDVRLSPATQAEIEAVWRDPCLWGAPQFLASALPLASGGWASSLDGPVTLLDLQDGDRRWGGIQDSWRLGRPGELASLTLNAAFGLPKYLDRSARASGALSSDELGEHPLAPSR